MTSASGAAGAAQTRPSLAERIRRGDPLAGLLVKMPAAAVVEMAAHVGFDFVVIDTEHGARDSHLLEAHVRAADAVGIPVLVRVPRGNGHEMLFALDAGVVGLVVPRVVAPADVDAIVRAAFYPPVGSRGLALSTRAGHHGLRDVGAHVDAALRDTVVVVQIEDAEALPNAASIAAHPRVDAVFIGPNDLSSSMGLPGECDHPAVRSAVDEVATAVLAADATALCMLATSAEEALAWRGRGASMTILTAEILISRCLAAIAGALRAQVEPAPEQPS
jgi:2-keto-3-deoxy-L-rhamnonate aldolase RhmA